jgi:hypothetical protein
VKIIAKPPPPEKNESESDKEDELSESGSSPLLLFFPLSLPFPLRCYTVQLPLSINYIKVLLYLSDFFQFTFPFPSLVFFSLLPLFYLLH